jgi:four helix bundle protein
VGDFHELRAWHEAIRFAVLSRSAIRRLPPDERFSLATQWRRAAYSVALNLAEGAARTSRANFRRHVDIARGSLDELESILDLVRALDYLSESELQALRASRSNCAKMVAGLLRSLRDD